ncbi:putative oxidoreductase ucpA [Corynespora cassiicola Philippines]|uniref:Putative oxidoreductase ucpA n=1 Tax=Corynespora cassiicola Philippines TaxID=1448308 RepID=A0A2T2NIX3_CORCC|nr:putative oxidoreductase ucpA [Corynespora cassiicola Philippines]
MASPPHTGLEFPGKESVHNDIYPAINASQNPSLAQLGKKILITGAGRGIGRSTALQYAYASAEAIILCARSTSELDAVASEIRDINSTVKVSSFKLDVTDEAAVKSLVGTITDEFGALDVLINNAGAAGPWVPLHETEPAYWWHTLEVNLKGPFLMLQAFLPLLVKTAEASGKGHVHVVNVTSIGAHVVAPGGSSYMTSKLALLRLTEFVDVEYRDKGVIAIGVHPGGIVSKLSNEVPGLAPKLTDTPELAGGFSVWLTAEKREWLAGRYVAATWDVEKLESMKGEILEGDKLKVRMAI